MTDFKTEIPNWDLNEFIEHSTGNGELLLSRKTPEGHWTGKSPDEATEVCHMHEWIEDNMPGVDLVYENYFDLSAGVKIIFLDRDDIGPNGERVVLNETLVTAMRGRITNDAGTAAQLIASFKETLKLIILKVQSYE